MAQDHNHGHTHAHAAPVGDSAFVWGLALNVGYLTLEAGIGFWIGSLALLADAAHNLTDAGGLLIAWGAAAAARLGPRGAFSYGFGRGTILAALTNALAILIGVGVVLAEAVSRIGDPPPVAAGLVGWVAALGIAVNAGTALLFMKAAAHDLNAKGAFLHMAADAGVSAAVVVAAILMALTGAWWLDPAAAILVSVAIAWTSWGLLRSALRLALDGAPEGVDRDALRADLAALPGVTGVHDLHVWALSTTRTALSAHLTMPCGHPGDAFLEDAAHRLHDRFDVDHVTLQIELGEGCDQVCAPVR